ncbi:hypothetical protein KC207_05170 [Phycicoccus sp. BSK3Z-2]|uniref:Rhamnogalacturonase A/B/Epimerase-like pectate lyase domain-containing protein n=1 Tax=Phycicoccus avicenniae TaxID=2828860 RepID=A0A941D6N5_9MICO|nr:glycosyl hydrolase family 28-related protein [Phycicoccus avicenniae]MBR7742678.1 hypothetical protein [Phycicoccus avicenniae]
MKRRHPSGRPVIDRRGVLRGLGAAGLGVAGSSVFAAPSAAGRTPPSGRPGSPPGQARKPTSPYFAERVVYPQAVYADGLDGVGVFDVRRHFGAVGNGVTDDTAAFVAAYDHIVDRYQAERDDVARSSQNIIYVPDGDYLVSDTILYTAALLENGNGQEQIARVRFQGESRDGTVIRLRDEAPGFGEGAHKPVLSLAKGVQNGSVASNYVQNLTIDTGSGNPGAVGLVHAGANNGGVRQVTIRSGDGTGDTGLSLEIQVTQGSYRNLVVEGFDTGIFAGPPRGFSVAFEHVALTGQRVAGIHVEDAVLSVRDLENRNRVPAAVVSGDDGLLVLLESRLVGGAPAEVAVESRAGGLLVRDVVVGGYAGAVSRAGEVAVPTGRVTEYSAQGVQTLFPTAEHTLGLAVEETPLRAWPEDVEAWANVQDFGAVGDGVTDDSAAIQAAMDSGAAVVHFQPGHRYVVEATVTVPSSVERVNFMYTHVVQGPALDRLDIEEGLPMFRVGGRADDVPLVVEDLFGWIQGEERSPVIDHASRRTLVVLDCHHQHAPIYRNSVTGGCVFLESVSCRTGRHEPHKGLPGFVFTGQKVWARFLDPEYGDPNLVNDGSDLWVMACKFEGGWTMIDTVGGGRTEMLGGMNNVFHGGWTIDADRPMLRTVDSDVSYTLGTFGFGNHYVTLAEETRGEETRTLQLSDVPRRWNDTHSFLPLYVGRGR